MLSTSQRLYTSYHNLRCKNTQITTIMKKFLFFGLFFCLFASLHAQVDGKILGRLTTRVQWDDSTGTHHIYDCHDVIDGEYQYLLYRKIENADGIVFYDIDKRNCFSLVISKLR
jgi:hypothetical protein